jgi:hypothetical protein
LTGGKNVFRFIWRSLGSINFTIWLLVLIACNLAIGGLYARLYPKMIGRLDYMRFQDWISADVLSTGWWILLLFLMIFMLSINTAICTVDQLLVAVKRRSKDHPGAFFANLFPPLMHVCFIVVILGHAVSQFAFEEIRLPVRPGTVIDLSTGRLTVDNQDCVNWDKPGLRGVVKQCSATLALRTPGETIHRKVGILSPVFWEDYAIHMKMSGNPKPGELPRLELLIKRDPGLKPMLLGGVLFSILIVLHFAKIFKSHRGGA